MAREERELQSDDALRELQRAAQRQEELADAYQRKAQKYRAEARDRLHDKVICCTSR